MARRSTTFSPGIYYHIYNRGAHRMALFCDDGDYLRLLQLLKEYSSLLSLSVIAYCLMPNHYHWLIRQDGAPAARLLPQRVFNAYSHAFNTRRSHSGTLFEGRYKAIPVTNDNYLHQLCRYIHANPVHHGFAVDPGLWPYSNYLDWIGERNGKLVDKEFVKEHFGTSDAYKTFVMSYVAGQAILPQGLGDYLQALDSEA
ncbi:MAG: transposase [Caldilineaceae bacterium]